MQGARGSLSSLPVSQEGPAAKRQKTEEPAAESPQDRSSAAPQQGTRELSQRSAAFILDGQVGSAQAAL